MYDCNSIILESAPQPLKIENMYNFHDSETDSCKCEKRS